MTRYLDSQRLRAVYVDEARLADDILAATLKASLQLSTSQTTQLVLQVVDEDLALISGGFMGKGTRVQYAKLDLEVAVREIIVVGSSTPAAQFTCRARGVQRLRRATGARVWKNLSWTSWAQQQAADVGMTFVGQPSARKGQIVRKTEKGSPPESTWDTLQNGASELGFLAFESQGVLYFGQPTWLAAHLPQYALRWAGSGANTKTTPGLLGVPQIRDSDDDATAGYTGSLSVLPDLSELLAPACAITVRGLGPYSARYLSTDVTLDLDGVTAASVSISTPVNPDPQPDTSADDGSGKSGSKGDTGGGVDQYGNATGPAYVPTPVYKPDQKPATPRNFPNGGHKPV